MTLQENVEAAIKHGRSVIANYEDDILQGYIFNESTTRYAIIDPILTALGWKLNDPTQCRFEEWRRRRGQENSGRPDYSLYKKDYRGVEKLVVLVEAKALTQSLNGFREENQLQSYSANPNPKVRVLTNGRHWYLYRNNNDYGKYRCPDVDISPDTDIFVNAKKLIESLSSRKRWLLPKM